MAGMMIDFRENPRYQRLIQKISAMGPEQRAIFNTARVDEAFAGDAMKRHLDALSMAADRQARAKAIEHGEKRLGLAERRLGLSKNAFDTQTGLTREARDFANKQSRWGTYIGMANVPLAAYTGYKEMGRDFDEAEETRKHRDRIKKLLEGGK